MYNANEALTHQWQALAQFIIQALMKAGYPHRIVYNTSPDDLGSFWESDEMLMSQTCGYPLITKLVQKVKVVATPLFACPGFSGIHYSSAIVVRPEHSVNTLADLRGHIAVINSADSHSGANALRYLVAELAHAGRFFASVVKSGSHWNSLQCLQDGNADVAAIDCVTWFYMQRYQTHLTQGLKLLCWSHPAPALPFIVHQHLEDRYINAIQQALPQALKQLPAVRDTLAIDDFAFLSLTDYAEIAQQNAKIAQLQYRDF